MNIYILGLSVSDRLEFQKLFKACTFNTDWSEQTCYIIFGRAASLQFNLKCRLLKIKPKKYVVKDKKGLTNIHTYDKLILRNKILNTFNEPEGSEK